MILEVLAHTREIVYHRDSESLKKCLGSDTRQLQNLGGVSGTGCQNDFLPSRDGCYTIRGVGGELFGHVSLGFNNSPCMEIEFWGYPYCNTGDFLSIQDQLGYGLAGQKMEI